MLVCASSYSASSFIDTSINGLQKSSSSSSMSSRHNIGIQLRHRLNSLFRIEMCWSWPIKNADFSSLSLALSLSISILPLACSQHTFSSAKNSMMWLWWWWCWCEIMIMIMTITSLIVLSRTFNASLHTHYTLSLPLDLFLFHLERVKRLRGHWDVKSIRLPCIAQTVIIRNVCASLRVYAQCTLDCTIFCVECVAVLQLQRQH